MKLKRLSIIIGIIALVLLIPLIAMQFTSEVSWTLPDFIIAGVLLFSATLVIDFVHRKLKKSEYRMLIIIGVIILFLLIWAELAVGILESPFAGS